MVEDTTQKVCIHKGFDDWADWGCTVYDIYLIKSFLLPLIHINLGVSVTDNFFLFRKQTKRARDLWWNGLPPSVRGRVWKLAIGNELNITSGKNMFYMFLSSKTVLKTCGKISTVLIISIFPN